MVVEADHQIQWQKDHSGKMVVWNKIMIMKSQVIPFLIGDHKFLVD